MSWDYFKYKAVCKQCGREGVCISGSNDWGQTSTRWEGFEDHEPHPHSVAKKRASFRDMVPVCVCGSSQIDVGKKIENS
jgi:hypothetical protein